MEGFDSYSLLFTLTSKLSFVCPDFLSTSYQAYLNTDFHKKVIEKKVSAISSRRQYFALNSQSIEPITLSDENSTEICINVDQEVEIILKNIQDTIQAMLLEMYRDAPKYFWNDELSKCRQFGHEIEEFGTKLFSNFYLLVVEFYSLAFSDKLLLPASSLTDLSDLVDTLATKIISPHTISSYHSDFLQLFQSVLSHKRCKEKNQASTDFPTMEDIEYLIETHQRSKMIKKYLKYSLIPLSIIAAFFLLTKVWRK